MVTLQEIKQQIEDMKGMLKGKTTIEDCRQLRHLGFVEDEIAIEIEEGNPILLKDAMEEYKDWDNTKVLSISVQNYQNISFLSYNIENEMVCFDVYDEDFDEEYNMMEDVLLSELDDTYNEIVETLREERT